MMKLVFSSPDKLLVAHIRNLLEVEGIACQVKNEYLLGAAGELPLNEIWPELWLENSIDYPRARAIIHQLLQDEPCAAPWVCPQCNEQIDGQFDVCWQCGCVRDGAG